MRDPQNARDCRGCGEPTYSRYCEDCQADEGDYRYEMAKDAKLLAEVD